MPTAARPSTPPTQPPGGNPAQPDQNPEQLAEEPRSSLWRDLLIGVSTQSWLASMVFHMALFIVLALTVGSYELARRTGQSPEFDAFKDDFGDLPEIARF